MNSRSLFLYHRPLLQDRVRVSYLRCSDGHCWSLSWGKSPRCRYAMCINPGFTTLCGGSFGNFLLGDIELTDRLCRRIDRHFRTLGVDVGETIAALVPHHGSAGARSELLIRRLRQGRNGRPIFWTVSSKIGRRYPAQPIVREILRHNGWLCWANERHSVSVVARLTWR